MFVRFAEDGGCRCENKVLRAASIDPWGASLKKAVSA